MWSSQQQQQQQQQQPELLEPSSGATIPQCPSSVQQQSVKRSCKLGPPQYIKPRPYSSLLERLETDSNARLIGEYEEDVYKHYVTLEQLSEINPKMIDLQPEIEWFMRPYLLDFLIEMHTSFKLKPQTLFLCLNIIDRYCSRRIVFKQHYQLIGCTAMWMAAKYEDKKSRVPTLRELSMMCRNVYDESMFKEMEMHMLSTLDWCLGHISLEDCLHLSIKSAKQDSPMATPTSNVVSKKSVENAIIAISRYLCELSLFQRSFLLYPTSLIAITAHLMACSMISDSSASQLLSRINDDYEYENHYGDYKKQYRNSANEDQFDAMYDDDDEDEDDEDNDDEMYDEDSENTKPTPKLPFISGFHGKKTIIQIRQISLLFINAINSPSEILVNKYTPLGVINVVNGFLHKHYTFLQQSINLLNLKDLKIDELSSSTFNSQLYQLSDLLLGLSYPELPHEFAQPHAIGTTTTTHHHHHQSSPPPLTPSSSTSQYSSSSIFSSGLKTPNVNTFMIKNPPPPTKSYNTQMPSKQQQQQQQRKKINYPNSSPVAELPSSPPMYDDYDASSNNGGFAKPMVKKNNASHNNSPAHFYANGDPVSSPLSHHSQQQNQNNMIY